MSALAEDWATLSPRERDARVAEARGEEFKPDNEVRHFSEYLKPYSHNWQYAGPLLDELAAEGWEISFERLGDEEDGEPALTFCLWRNGMIPKHTATAPGNTFTDAIALAYVLAKGETR